MSSDAIRAFVLLALVRRRRTLIVGATISIVGLLAAILLPGPMAWFGAFSAGLTFVLLTAVTPLALLATDKMYGHLELERTLPVSLRTIALGRLLGAAARTLAIVPTIAAIDVALLKTMSGIKVAPLVTGSLVMVLTFWCVLWIALALQARSALRRLVWLPAVICVGAMVMLPAIGTVAEAQVSRIGDLLFQADASVLVLMVIASLGIGFTAAVLLGSSTLLGTALARFQHDPGATSEMLENAPRTEFVAAGRGPVLAIARLRLRQASPQFRRDILLVGVLLVIIIADVGKFADLAHIYLRVVTAMMTGAVAMQLFQARMQGSLESIQQLPHSRRLVGLGHVLAVMAMVVPAVMTLSIASATEGTTLTVGSVLLRWSWLVAAGSMVAAGVIWLTRWRIYATLAVAILGPLALMMLSDAIVGRTGVPSGDRFASALVTWDALRDATGSAIPIAFALGVTVLANELFAWGLRTYSGTSTPMAG